MHARACFSTTNLKYKSLTPTTSLAKQGALAWSIFAMYSCSKPVCQGTKIERCMATLSSRAPLTVAAELARDGIHDDDWHKLADTETAESQARSLSACTRRYVSLLIRVEAALPAERSV